MNREKINVDMTADVVPMKSAAGFYIGMEFELVKPLIDKYYEYYQGFNVVKTVNNNDRLICIKYEEGNTVYIKKDVVRLAFNKNGILFSIFVFDGYIGSYKSFCIGNSINKVRSIEKLQYDEGDEMHYRVNSNGEIIPGLAFIAHGSEDNNENDDPILGFSIHDWSLQNRYVNV